ncbi:MAG: DoxX family protein, partial [Pirellula sp.]
MLFKKAKLTLPAIVFLVLLRLGIGWHFFQEGAVKITDGFSSTGFLASAKGPFAPMFQSMIPDHDGMIRIDAKKMSDACEAYGEKVKTDFGLNEDQRKEVDAILAEYKTKRKETYDEWKPQIEEYKNGFERIEKLNSDRSRSKVDSL